MAIISKVLPSQDIIDENIVKEMTIVWKKSIEIFMEKDFNEYWPVAIHMSKGKGSLSSDIIVTCQKPQDGHTKLALETVCNDFGTTLKYT